MDNNLLNLLDFVSGFTDQKEYNKIVNTLAQLLMGNKFNYDKGSEYADVVLFKAEARNLYKHNANLAAVKDVTLTALGKKEPIQLKIIKGGKDDIDQK